jgi:hypothetical protein
MAIRFAPRPCGVRVATSARRGRLEYSVFFPRTPAPRQAGKRVVVGGALRAGHAGAGHIVTGGRYLSPSYGTLVRSRILARAPAAFSVAFRGRCARR